MKNVFITLIVLLSSSLCGCWDDKYSPNISNVSGRDIEIKITFEDKEQSYFIKDGSSLLLTNILKEERFKNIQILYSVGDKVLMSKQEIQGYIKTRSQDIFIASDLTVSDIRL